MCLPINVCLSVADNARYDVFLHVSASRERKERRNITGAMTKIIERHILTHSNICNPTVLCFYAIEYLVVQIK